MKQLWLPAHARPPFKRCPMPAGRQIALDDGRRLTRRVDLDIEFRDTRGLDVKVWSEDRIQNGLRVIASHVPYTDDRGQPIEVLSVSMSYEWGHVGSQTWQAVRHAFFPATANVLLVNSGGLLNLADNSVELLQDVPNSGIRGSYVD